MAEKIHNVLYHYCSLDTFYNIVKNQSIWLSDITKSNDSQELNWLKETIAKNFFSIVPEIPSNLHDLSKEAILAFKSTKETVNSILNNECVKSWVFCLSEKEDNLGQWRGYADDAKGLSIGFKKDFLKDFPDIKEVNDSKQILTYGKIKYGKSEVIGFLRDFIGNIDEEHKLEMILNKIRTAFGGSLIYAPYYKNDSFREEEEWRIVCSISAFSKEYESPIYAIQQLPLKQVIASDYSFVPKNNTLVSHIELKIKDMKSAIASVTIGPKSNLTALDVKLFLVSLGLLDDVKDESIKVSRSSASYR